LAAVFEGQWFDVLGLSWVYDLSHCEFWWWPLTYFTLCWNCV